MAQITISHLTFAHDGMAEALFDDVSFQLDTDWRLGFVGRNGRGKTTFLNLLLGQFEYHGTIAKPVACDYFPFPVADENLPTREIAAQVVPDCEPWRLERELSRLEVAAEVLDRPFCTLSHGERTKILLAALLLREDRFLLIDEPTNHLDARGRGIVSEYLRTKRGFILVSHDRAFLDHCVDHILAINREDIEIQRGNFSSWYENKSRQDQCELAENERLGKEIGRLRNSSRRTEEWSGKTEKRKFRQDKTGPADNLPPDRGFMGRKSAKMMQRAKSMDARRESAAEEKSRLLKNVETTERLRIHPLEYHAQYLVTADDLSIFYGEKPVCGPLRFDIRRGGRLAIIGGNGSGKTSLLKLLAGEMLDFQGTLRRGSQLKISYVPQDTSFLTGDLTDFSQARGLDEPLFKAILRKLDFSREQFTLDMRDFSAGQKKKVLLAASLCEPAHLYIWDEPLNYIDIFSRMQIQDLLVEHAPTLVFVEHDRDFTEKIATTRVEM